MRIWPKYHIFNKQLPKITVVAVCAQNNQLYTHIWYACITSTSSDNLPISSLSQFIHPFTSRLAINWKPLPEEDWKHQLQLIWFGSNSEPPLTNLELLKKAYNKRLMKKGVWLGGNVIVEVRSETSPAITVVCVYFSWSVSSYIFIYIRVW